ncbi:hypothetical protein E4U59_000629 [Claviceps monticola]|nr:hypothetical protein E4U59_000629 [Claviceps monticola]
MDGCLQRPGASEFSTGWLTRFKKKFNIKQRTTHGESGSVDDVAAETQLKTFPIASYAATNPRSNEESEAIWESSL